MDASKRNTEDLLKEIIRFETQLFRRYQNIIELASSSSQDAPNIPSHSSSSAQSSAQPVDNEAIRSRNTAAYNSQRMEMESSALIKTCEDILSLSRVMKEMWLFGKLNTLREGVGRGEEKVEADALAVGGLVERLLGSGAEAAGWGEDGGRA